LEREKYLYIDFRYLASINMVYPFVWARRSPLRYLVLCMLRERPMTGMDIMREIERMTLGFWRPSPGTIYPLLRLLEREGLVYHEERDGRKVYKLTERGEDLAKEVAALLPARTLEDVVDRLESLASYLQDYVAECGPLPEDLRRRVRRVIEDLERVAG